MRDFDSDAGSSIVSITDRVRPLPIGMPVASIHFLGDNAVFIGGPGTGKTHLASAIGVAGITRHGKRVRFYSTVDLVNKSALVCRDE